MRTFVSQHSSWGKGGNVTSSEWQVTLCDPIWHVSSRSGEACCELLYPVTLVTLLTLLTYSICSGRAFGDMWHSAVTDRMLFPSPNYRRKSKTPSTSSTTELLSDWKMEPYACSLILIHKGVWCLSTANNSKNDRRPSRNCKLHQGNIPTI